jgi:hypothetical protein
MARKINYDEHIIICKLSQNETRDKQAFNKEEIIALENDKEVEQHKKKGYSLALISPNVREFITNRI